MKLKTLKDIQEEINKKMDNYDLPKGTKPLINNQYNKLKQEAIKWVRELEKAENWEDNKTVDSKFKYFPELVDTYYDNCDSLGAIKVLKIFFNITEEDLK